MASVLFHTWALSTLHFDNSLKLLLAREWNVRCWEHIAAEIAHCDRDVRLVHWRERRVAF